jgi:hypothetical protein
MSILDDAIREHLELKRAHGADEAELKKLEDEAFGPPGRPEEPDPFAEAPTEFMAQPGAGEVDVAETPGRRINVADLQEPPPPEPQEEAPAAQEDEAEEPLAPEPVAEAPSETTGPNTAEREAIAEQPTEFFDIESQLEPEAAPSEAASPSDEELVEEEIAEPRLAPGGRFDSAPADDLEDEEDDDFWSEQRLSEELDQALEAPIADEHELPPQAPVTDEHAVPASDAAPATDEHARPVTDEHDAPQAAGERTEEQDRLDPDYDPDTGQEDVLEGTPEFLEDAPEDDDLWFEQRPPKDFDFDD